ncbi:MAG TPA: hypothetical protein VHM28_01715 [Anaerolineales bacterium]|jgi:hypothetical protein|nr:hypothetical protein [Anaerolineales bacterium]
MQKFDGVIEAVRYKNGKIDVVRAYERRGATFSDRVLIDRKGLIDRLSQGKHFITGQRREFLASTFDTGKPIHLVGEGERQIVSTQPQSERDELEGVPAF